MKQPTILAYWRKSLWMGWYCVPVILEVKNEILTLFDKDLQPILSTPIASIQARQTKLGTLIIKTSGRSYDIVATPAQLSPSPSSKQLQYIVDSESQSLVSDTGEKANELWGAGMALTHAGGALGAVGAVASVAGSVEQISAHAVGTKALSSFAKALKRKGAVVEASKPLTQGQIYLIVLTSLVIIFGITGIVLLLDNQ